MEISVANIADAETILALQKLAYQSEAEIYQNHKIPPLQQTIKEIIKEFGVQTFFKAIDKKCRITGSVRAYLDDKSCFIGRLIVHPEWQGKGVGTQLMNSIEFYFSQAQRYELFTGTKSMKNIQFYKKLGYKPFKEQVINKSFSLLYLEKNSQA